MIEFSGSFKSHGRKKETNAEIQAKGIIHMVLHRTEQLSYCLQLVRMLMVVVTLYTLSYFPLNIVWVSQSSCIFLVIGLI